MKEQNQQVERTPLGEQCFPFACHPGVACFTRCCRGVDLDLYPFDIIELKKGSGLVRSRSCATIPGSSRGAESLFPHCKLKLVECGSGICLSVSGRNRGVPSITIAMGACRTYPLERAVDRRIERGRAADCYFLTKHSYCLGHYEDQQVNVRQWLRSQRLAEHNMMNELWTEVDTILRTNPFKGEGSGGPTQQLVFMACYNIDGFRNFVLEHGVLESLSIAGRQRRCYQRDDKELLKFALEWVKTFVGWTLFSGEALKRGAGCARGLKNCSGYGSRTCLAKRPGRSGVIDGK